jgi:hypothetical protein
LIELYRYLAESHSVVSLSTLTKVQQTFTKSKRSQALICLLFGVSVQQGRRNLFSDKVFKIFSVTLCLCG